MVITAEAVKNAYLGQGVQLKQKTLIEMFTQHNKEMAASLKWGTMKNYYTTAKYLKEFLTNRFPGGIYTLSNLITNSFPRSIYSYAPIPYIMVIHAPRTAP
jgi:hypothetical protein